MKGTHHATIARLVAKVRKLQIQNNFLNRNTDVLQEVLVAAFYMSADESPRAVLHALRQELAGPTALDRIGASLPTKSPISNRRTPCV
jgi:hypothetical protein